MVMACRNALASYLSGLRSRNSPCRWAERRHILRPKLLSGLESLTTSPTHSMVSHPTPSPSLPSFYSGCERHCRVCDDSELARRRLPPPFLPFAPKAVRLRSFVVVFSLLACSLVHGEYRTSGTRARLSAWRRAERGAREGARFSVSRPLRPAGQLHRRPVAGGAAGRVRRGRGAVPRRPPPVCLLLYSLVSVDVVPAERGVRRSFAPLALPHSGSSR